MTAKKIVSDKAFVKWTRRQARSTETPYVVKSRLKFSGLRGPESVHQEENECNVIDKIMCCALTRYIFIFWFMVYCGGDDHSIEQVTTSFCYRWKMLLAQSSSSRSCLLLCQLMWERSRRRGTRVSFSKSWLGAFQNVFRSFHVSSRCSADYPAALLDCLQILDHTAGKHYKRWIWNWSALRELVYEDHRLCSWKGCNLQHGYIHEASIASRSTRQFLSKLLPAFVSML